MDEEPSTSIEILPNHQDNDDDSNFNEDDSREEETKGIEVFLRIRNANNPSTYFRQDDIDQSQIIFDLSEQKQTSANQDGKTRTNDNGNSIVDNSRSRYAFKFNGILDSKSKQEEVFRTIGAPAVKNVLDGYNSTVFAYGQTGSGKTFTITGGPERYSDRGIIPRAISMLFASFEEQSRSQKASFACYISYLELYNESGYDLLASANGSSNDENGHGGGVVEVLGLEDMPKVTMLEDEDGNYHFRNLSVNHVHTEEDALNLLFLGDTNRAIGESELNQSSSRSHCIFTIMVEKRMHNSDSVIRSKLNLVDLAGSERVHKTNSTGQSLKEAQHINTSLFFLEMVIVALHEQRKKGKENTHVPYRNSMMTSVLRDSLGGNCKTIMVATISPESEQSDESISTCHFAQRVALVKNIARVNEELEPEVIIRKLRAELMRVREEVKFLKGENVEEDFSNYTKEEIEVLTERVNSYIAAPGENVSLDIGAITLTKIQTVFAIFKDIVIKSREVHRDMVPPHKWATIASSDDSDSEDDIETLRNRITSLKNAVQQRDDEINAICSSSGRVNGDTILHEKYISQQHGNQMTSHLPPLNRPQNSTVKIRNVENTQICGVDVCTAENILQDPAKAFDWFRRRYPGTKSIAENKSLLQSRFQEAKVAAEVIKKCKKEIDIHSSRIKKIRSEITMEKVLGTHVDNGAPPDELECVSLIEDNKRKYKAEFEHLRELKKTIDQIKNLTEKYQRKMQIDFDTWYAKMYGLLGHKSEKQIHDQGHTPANDDSVGVEVLGSELVQTNIPRQDTPDEMRPVPSTSNTFKLPPGVRLTGIKEADDDIIAFYLAKEALMARSKARS